MREREEARRREASRRAEANRRAEERRQREARQRKEETYRMAAKKYHPDILRAGGMPEAEVRKASAMMAKVNEAWEKIRKARGI